MPRGHLLSGLIAGVACLVGASPALAQNQLYRDFRGDGVISPCRYSDQQLRRGLQGLPPDVRQYAPGFADQLNAARQAGCGGAARPAQGQQTEQREAGAPSRGPRGGGGGGSEAPASESVPRPPEPKASPVSRLAKAPSPHAPVAPDSGDDTPVWLVVLLIALAGPALAAVLLARYRGWSTEGFTRPLRASFADAGDRTADAGAQLRDRMMGR